MADLPIYPFGGVLTASIAPDRRQVAVLATLRAIAQQRGVTQPYNVDHWHVEKRLGFVDLSAGAPIRWVSPPTEARLPVELLDWSPDSRKR